MSDRLILGWREWVSLPEPGLPAIKIKIDTGANTSALHAFEVESYKRNGIYMLRLAMRPPWTGPHRQPGYVLCRGSA